MWAANRDKITGFVPDESLMAAVQRTLDVASWENMQKRFEQGNWTLVHGDHHPANQLYDPKTEELILLDWENLGLGSGP